MSLPTSVSSRRLAPGGIAVAILGLLLFAYTVHTAGVAETLSGVQRVGWGFAALLVVSGIREILRSLAWTRCVEGPAPLRFREAFAARLMGEALGNLTPFGLFVSEPAKVTLVRSRVPLMASVAALTIENLIYSVSAAVMIAAGAVTLLAAFSLPGALEATVASALVITALVLMATLAIVRTRPRIASGLLRFLTERGPASWRQVTFLDRVRTLEESVYSFSVRHSARVLQVIAADVAFHVLGVLEVYVTLRLLTSAWPSVIDAFVLETVNRAITVAFKFVPLRLGVDEAGTGLLTNVLNFGTATGVAMAIVRKARVLFWSGIGLALLVRRGLSIGPALGHGETEARSNPLG